MARTVYGMGLPLFEYLAASQIVHVSAVLQLIAQVTTFI